LVVVTHSNALDIGLPDHRTGHFVVLGLLKFSPALSTLQI